jgi:hypothetical protein
MASSEPVYVHTYGGRAVRLLTMYACTFDCDNLLVMCCVSAQVMGAQLALPGNSSSGLPARLGAASGKGFQQCHRVKPSPRRLMDEPSHSLPLLHSFLPYGLPSSLELHLGLPRTPQTLVQDRTHSLWASRLCWRPLSMQVATCPLSTQVRVHNYVSNRSCEVWILLRGARVTPMFSQA